MISTTGTIEYIEYSASQDVIVMHIRPRDPFTFLEGQFVMLQTLINDKIVKRSYSISSSSLLLEEKGIFCCSIKRKENGVFSTRATQQARPGMELGILGPLGKFVDPKTASHYLFVSVGSGLSPCASLISKLYATNEYTKIANLFGEKVIANIPDSIMQLYQEEKPGTWHQICLSRETPTGDHPTIVSGYVQSRLDDALQFLGTTEISVFICGLPAMCDEVKQILLEKGLRKEQLIIEKY